VRILNNEGHKPVVIMGVISVVGQHKCVGMMGRIRHV
jgi:hypothetical protein